VGRVAAEAFGLDPGRLAVPPLDGLDIPQLRAAMGAVDAELKAGGAGWRLAAESLANELGHRLAAPSAESEATYRDPDAPNEPDGLTGEP
jgi:hypothetical protein